MFLSLFAERARFELANQFCRSHAFQACLFSHSSISPFMGRTSVNCVLTSRFSVTKIAFFLILP